MKETILISGITGFVGVNLEKYLGFAYKIIGFSRKETTNHLSYRLLSLESFSKAKAFVHLAGKAHDLKNISNENDYFEANTVLTKKLFDQFLKSECKIFIYMSSVKAAADVVADVLTEDVTPNPVTVYGKSKLAAENYILSKKIPEAKRVYILRPCMIHGPNNKGNLNLLYNFVSKGVPYPFAKYRNKRSFVSVENLCFIIKELIDSKKIKSGIYNIADDKPLSTVNLVEIIGEVLGKPTKILSLPKFFVNTFAKIGDILPLPINSERLQKLTENYIVSNQKIKNQLQKELPLSAKKGVEKTIASF